MQLETDERLRLAAQHALAVVADARTLSAVLGIPLDEVEATSEAALAGDLDLSDLGIGPDDLRAVLATRGGGDPEIEAVRVAFALLGSRRERIVEAISAPSPGPGR